MTTTTHRVDFTVFDAQGEAHDFLIAVEAPTAFEAADRAMANAIASQLTGPITEVFVNHVDGTPHIDVIMAHVAEAIAVHNDPTLGMTADAARHAADMIAEADTADPAYLQTYDHLHRRATHGRAF